MSMLVELPLELYEPKAFAAFNPVAGFDLGTARSMAWMSQLAYESEHPDKIAAICEMWGLRRPRIIRSPPARFALTSRSGIGISRRPPPYAPLATATPRSSSTHRRSR